jgi:hypothetical protein
MSRASASHGSTRGYSSDGRLERPRKWFQPFPRLAPGSSAEVDARERQVEGDEPKRVARASRAAR